MKTTFIYALCEPGTRTVKYIGKTANPKRRLQEHLKRSIKKDNYLGNWLRLVISKGKRPDLIVLREVPGDGSDAERRYIRIAWGCGMKLVNATDGGDSGTPCLETRAKISRKLKGRFSGEKNPFFGKTHTKECRAVIGAVHKGVPLPVGHPLIGWCKGKPRSKEHCENLSKSLTGLIRPPEHCAAISKGRMGCPAPNKGVSPSPETRASISAARRAGIARRKQQDQDIEWALAPYTLE